MKDTRLRKYLEQRKKNRNTPILEKDEIATNPDNKIDQDFEGYPHGPAKDETIKPKTGTQKKTADLDNKDGEKKESRPSKKAKAVIDEQESNGSANAFEDK
jgi:hypothetical protein